MARAGKLERYLDANSLTKLLGDIFNRPDPGLLGGFIKRRIKHD